MQSNGQMISFVTNLLHANLSPFYFYHNVAHTLYVFEKVIEIGNAANCTQQEIELLKVAALWHDSGYITTYANHEEEGCRLVKKYLPEYGYAANKIDIICGMIMATKIPQSPHNKLEEIIADADLAYLGTATAEKKATDLFKELQHLNPLLTTEQWNQTQISFLQKHHYFTSYCKQKKEPAKLAYLKKLIAYNT